MPVRELARLSWEQIDGLERARCVAILPAGALEAHGPHLPLATDVIIAEAMARAGAERLAARGYEVLLLPAMPFTPAPFAAGFPGTLSIRAQTMRTLVLDIGRALASHGVRTLAVANAHLDPEHLQALHEAGDALREEDIVYVFPDLTSRASAKRLTAEFRSGACHAGSFETSIVLAVSPELVDDPQRRALAPVPHSLSEAIRAGKRTFEEAGGERAYFGDPAAASVAEGRRTIDVLGRILEEAVMEAMAG